MATATTSIAPVSPLTGFNQFQLVSHSGKTKVSYTPDQGPIVVGRPPATPFVYSGPEGEMSFTDNQISWQTTPMGTLLSVVFTPQIALHRKTFSLILPPVAGTGPHSITTYAVETQEVESVKPHGAQLTYQVERFQGMVEQVALRA